MEEASPARAKRVNQIEVPDQQVCFITFVGCKRAIAALQAMASVA